MRPFDPRLETLRNLNTPADYEKALADWAAHPENPGRLSG
jgi:hypothetical protein